MANSDATKEEVLAAQAKRQDGSQPIEIDRRPYRPKLSSTYQEPEYYPDDDGLEILFRENGKALCKEPKPLSPRDDIIEFGPDKQEEHEKSAQWKDCPDEARELIAPLLKEFWDVFDSDGMKQPIQGFQAVIDTGKHAPVCCQLPKHGAHESKVMTKLVEALEKNGLIEDDDGPWGALIVLAGKPHQEHKHWTECVWRLCVSHRKLNTVTRPFTFLSQRCDDAVNDLGHAKYFIVMDLAWGYWQVELHEGSKSKTGFFAPNGKKRWSRMPMGALNSHATFCAMMEKLKKKWNVNYEIRCKVVTVSTGTKAIVDDVFLHSNSILPQQFGNRRGKNRVFRVNRTQLVLESTVQDDSTFGLQPLGDAFDATVIHCSGDEVVLDMNHPLAGRDLVFEIRLLRIL